MLPSPSLGGTDNGAMVAACYRFEAGLAGWDLDVSPSLPVA